MSQKIFETIGKNHTGTGLLLENDGYASLDMPENQMLKESIEGFKSGEVNELPRPFIVSAVFQKYGVQNANGRIYPENTLKREVEKFQKVIDARRALLELEHPESSSINLERVCGIITELRWVGRTLIGKIEIPISEGFRKLGVCSTLADTVAQWLVSNIKFGVSSRALGDVQKVGDKLIVGDSLELITFDVVAQPSVNQAFIERDDESLRPYIEESCDSKKDNVINESEKKEDKYDKFKKWLNG